MSNVEIKSINFPWLISPSNSSITLNFIEDEESVVVTASAFFGKHHEEYFYYILNGFWAAAHRRDGKIADFVILQDGYYEVKFRFNGLLSATTLPNGNIGSVISTDRVFPWEEEILNGERYLNDFEGHWKESGYCPDSGFYELFGEENDSLGRSFILKGSQYSLILKSYGFSAI